MKKSTIFACLILTLIFTMNAFASDLPQRVIDHDSVFDHGNSKSSKSSRDTVFLVGPWGSGAQVNGQFEDATGNPQWNGWTHYDITRPTESHWHVSQYHADVLPGGAGNMAAYCGDETIPACSETDVIGGYGNHWNDILRFSYVVADPTSGCSVTVAGVFSHNTEPGYDFTHFEFVTADETVSMAAVDGVGVAVVFSHSMSYAVADYVGENQDEVRFEITFKSDGAWSDTDCLFSGNGACQVDDLHTTCTNGGYDQTETFDTDLGDWMQAFPLGTGDFTQLWVGLGDMDPCFANYSPQVAFIDDGEIVPGVGPSYCQDWCYGPNGYIVNTTGGAQIETNPEAYLHNALESPVLTWPGAEYIGASLTFGNFQHEDLSGDSPGIFITWGIRTAVNEADLEAAGWVDRAFVYYGPHGIYRRSANVIGDLLESGLTVAQVQFTCYELGWSWGYQGINGTPAPYFDNIRFQAYLAEGPALSTREIDRAQDNFPEIGDINLNILEDNNVRFDCAMNNGDDNLNVPGDSITCNVSSVRVGGELTENRLYFTVNANPVFDPARDHPMDGFVDAQVVVNNGAIVPGKFAYDLPDSGFLFPGDVLHYYFSATDEVNNATPETATLPADISGFGDFSRPQAYNSGYEVHCLPSVTADDTNPDIIFWNDFAGRGGEEEWYGALNNLGLTVGVDYDVYYTNGASSGVGNGLGGRCTDGLLARYTTMLYTAGNLGAMTISNGDPTNDPGQDIQLLTNWVAQNETQLFMTGDGLVTDLIYSGGATNTFLQDYINVFRTTADLRPLINNQATPAVIPIAGNSVFQTAPQWIAYGGCAGINRFDAVEALPGAERLARFANPSGVADYNYAAATLNLPGDDRVIYMPYDFMYIYTDVNHPVSTGVATRVNVLGDVLNYFQFSTAPWNPTGVPEAEKFFASNHPNPFNPSTKIEFNLPKAGHLSLKIYNVRGELIRTLIDESRGAGADHIMWNGTNDQGSSVSSGVYFYEARTAGEVKVNKMALVK